MVAVATATAMATVVHHEHPTRQQPVVADVGEPEQWRSSQYGSRRLMRPRTGEEGWLQTMPFHPRDSPTSWSSRRLTSLRFE